MRLDASGVVEDGNASGEFDVAGPMVIATAMTGGLHMVATMDIVMHGKLDADAHSDVVIPQVLRGLLAR